MRVTTAYNHCQRFLKYQADVYARARQFGMTYAELMGNIQRQVYDDPAWSRCPGWVRDKVHTVGHEKLAMLYLVCENIHLVQRRINEGLPFECLIWKLRYKGQKYDCWDDLVKEHPDARENHGDVQSTYVWNHTGTPFHPWKLTRHGI